MKQNMWFNSAMLALAIVLGACGKDNESGKKSGGTYFGSLGTIGGGSYPTNVTNPHIRGVFQSLSCLSGGQRVGVQFGLNLSVAANASYVGITSEGDIAFVTNSNGQAVFNAYICQRPGLGSGTGSMSSNPIVNRSLYCQIDEITKASMVLPGAPGFPPYVLNFRAIHFGVQGNNQFTTFLQTICR